MSKRLKLIILIIIAGQCNTLPRFLDFSDAYDSARYLLNYKLYITGQALSFSILILTCIFRRSSDKVVEIYLTALFWLSMNDLLDNLLFDPFKLGFNELIFSLIIISHAVYQYRQYKTKKIDNA